MHQRPGAPLDRLLELALPRQAGDQVVLVEPDLERRPARRRRLEPPLELARGLGVGAGVAEEEQRRMATVGVRDAYGLARSLARGAGAWGSSSSSVEVSAGAASTPRPALRQVDELPSD